MLRFTFQNVHAPVSAMVDCRRAKAVAASSPWQIQSLHAELCKQKREFPQWPAIVIADPSGLSVLKPQRAVPTPPLRHG
jgi:hypothetical protein